MPSTASTTASTATCTCRPGAGCTPNCPAPPAGQPTTVPPDRDPHRPAGPGRTPTQTHRQGPENPVAVVVRARRTRPPPLLAALPAPLRHRTHLPLRQIHPGLDHPRCTHPRTGRPVDLAHHRRLHPATPGPTSRRRPPAALGTTPRLRQTDPSPRPTRISVTARHHRHTSAATKIPPARTRTAHRHPTATTNPIPSDQKGRLTRIHRLNRKLRPTTDRERASALRRRASTASAGASGRRHHGRPANAMTRTHLVDDLEDNGAAIPSGDIGSQFVRTSPPACQVDHARFQSP
jgi:hypothetical protein